MVQTTVSEHAWSDERSTPCQGCHMPEGAGHRFVGVRDRRLRGTALAIEADAQRIEDGVRLTLRLTSQAGHAVPTGDIARRLEVTAWSGGARESVRFGRIVAIEGWRFTEVADTRVPARGERVVELDLESAGSVVRWRIDLLTLPLGGDVEGLDEDSLRYRLAAGQVRVARD